MSGIGKNKHGAWVPKEPENKVTTGQIELCLWQLMRVLNALNQPEETTTDQARANNTFVQRKIWPLVGIRPWSRTDKQRREYIIRTLKRVGFTAEDFR